VEGEFATHRVRQTKVKESDAANPLGDEMGVTVPWSLFLNAVVFFIAWSSS
jgi:hypothetical protein